MNTFIRRLRKLKANSFTLVELLVVISIIGVLAGLATPAMTKALDKGKQTTDISNGRQLYTLIFAAANDDADGGYYFFSSNAIGKESSFDVFNMLITNNQFPYGRKILAGTGVSVDTNTGSVEMPNAKNLFWGCTVGLDTSADASIPLLFSYGKHEGMLTNEATIDPTGAWKGKGIVIVNAGGGASFVVPGTGGASKSNAVRTGILTTNIDTTVVQALSRDGKTQ